MWRLSATFDAARGTAIGWIATIAHRRSVDMVRKAEASVRREVAHGIATYCPAQQDEPAAAAVARAEVTEVLEALCQLSSLQRQAVQMIYFSGLSAPEIALQLGVPLPTLRPGCVMVSSGCARLSSSARAISELAASSQGACWSWAEPTARSEALMRSLAVATRGHQPASSSGRKS